MRTNIDHHHSVVVGYSDPFLRQLDVDISPRRAEELLDSILGSRLYLIYECLTQPQSTIGCISQVQHRIIEKPEFDGHRPDLNAREITYHAPLLRCAKVDIATG
jgi:hypothetical protein